MLGLWGAIAWGCQHFEPEALRRLPLPNVHILRFDSLLFSIPLQSFDTQVVQLMRQYPIPSEAYFHFVMGLPSNDSVLISRLQQVVRDRYSQVLFQDILQAYPSLAPIESALQAPLRRYQFYLQVDSVPHFFSYISFFSYAVITYGKWVGIGLDMYLGPHYRFYPATIQHQYLIRRRSSTYLVPQVMKALFARHFPVDSFTDYTLISHAIYEGKKLYFLDLTLPHLPDSIKIEYTAQEMEWVEDNEAELWTFMIEQELLFNSKPRTVGRFFNEAPFTNYAGIPQDAPPRLGEWIGWQIVRSYMKKHPEISPLELFAEKDYQKIFQQSGYRPKVRYF